MTENQSDSEYYQHLEPIIDKAYSLYMPQVRSEITKLYRFLNQHYGLTKKSEPFNVLEIGTKFGGTFFLWCSMNQSSGLNISIDINDGGLHGGIDEKKMDERDGWFKYKFENSRFIRGNSHDWVTLQQLRKLSPEYINTEFLVHGGPSDLQWIDFLFIDGDHTYEGVKQDFEMYGQFVKKGGVIAFHDIKDTPRHRERDVYVSKFWNEITENRNEDNTCTHDGETYQVLEYIDPLTDWAGIGVLVKL